MWKLKEKEIYQDIFDKLKKGQENSLLNKNKRMNQDIGNTSAQKFQISR